MKMEEIDSERISNTQTSNYEHISSRSEHFDMIADTPGMRPEMVVEDSEVV